MTFNQGWLCEKCGPVKESKKRTIQRIRRDCCKGCGGIVTPWERPLNERPGRCGNCANAGFKLAVVKGQLLRNCKKCSEVINPETKKIIRKGKEEFKHEQRK